MEFRIVMNSDLLAALSTIELCLKKHTVHGSKNWRRNEMLKSVQNLIKDNTEGNRLSFENVDMVKIGKFIFKKVDEEN